MMHENVGFTQNGNAAFAMFWCTKGWRIFQNSGKIFKSKFSPIAGLKLSEKHRQID